MKAVATTHRFRVGLALCAVAIFSFAISTSAYAAETGRLRIRNQSKERITYLVPSDDNWWNCNDAPQRGFSVIVAAGATSPYFDFVRTEGHGCGGKQGQFSLVPSFDYNAPPQSFWYDSKGGLALTGRVPDYDSELTEDGNHNYTWTVTPTR